mmetsp:Transcript_39888/g.86357  ORF Transcript_39888/g.86357 Transcript_39888/m.86357 type:complete len:200 (+) Transcript_39888:175-774(+)
MAVAVQWLLLPSLIVFAPQLRRACRALQVLLGVVSIVLLAAASLAGPCFQSTFHYRVFSAIWGTLLLFGGALFLVCTWPLVSTQALPSQTKGTRKGTRFLIFTAIVNAIAFVYRAIWNFALNEHDAWGEEIQQDWGRWVYYFVSEVIPSFVILLLVDRTKDLLRRRGSTVPSITAMGLDQAWLTPRLLDDVDDEVAAGP